MTLDISHPLIEYVYQIFGERFAELILAGYGENAPPKKCSFLFTESYTGGEIDWTIDVLSDNPPCGDDPLVLAALLKLLLRSKPIVEPFYFEMGELTAILGWPDTSEGQEAIDSIIEKYMSLTFRKYEQRERKRYQMEGARWGTYKFISGYVVESIRKRGDTQLTRAYSRIDFDTGFIKGLNEGRVIFADLDFGVLTRVAMI